MSTNKILGIGVAVALIALVGLLTTMTLLSVKREADAGLCSANYGKPVPTWFMEIECIPQGVVLDNGTTISFDEVIARAIDGCQIVSGKIPDCTEKG